MKYNIICDDSHYSLAQRVEDLIKQGWLPQGGVSFGFHSGYKETWAQAMVKVDA